MLRNLARFVWKTVVKIEKSQMSHDIVKKSKKQQKQPQEVF